MEPHANGVAQIGTLHEALKKVGLLLFIYPDTGVGHRDDDVLRGGLFHSHDDTSAGRCVFEGIGEQVEEYLFDLRFVKTNLICFR